MGAGDSLTSKQISATYKDILQVPNSNSGVDTTTRLVMDGEGTESALQLSTTAVKSTGTLESTGDTTVGGSLILGAQTLSATATELNLLDGITAVDTDITSVSASDDTLASAKSIKTYVDSQILTKDNLDEIAEGVTNVHFTATDNTKFDGIETAATADQTGAEIKTAYEGEADTNAFTDADETKLDAIEASADVTDATNVTAAGALMDSELTDLAGVKGVTISTLQSKPSEGAFVDGDKTKLDGIETAADVTDATNVTAAGALMDSEVTDLDGVKSLTVPNSTTISAFGATLVDDADAAAARTTLGASASGHGHDYAAQGANSDITSLTGLTTDLAITHGGTGAGTAQDAIDSLSAVSGATNEHVLTKDTSTGNATWKAAAGGGASALDDLTDVNIGSVGSSEDNYVLKYDHDNTEWIAAVDSTSSGSGGATVAGATGEIQFNSADSLAASSNLFWDNSNNRLGIGGTPSSALHVTAGHLTMDSGYSILWEDGNNLIGGSGSSGSNYLNFNTNGAERMRIDSSGNVGIGTAAPAHKLDIAAGYVKLDASYGYGWGDLNTGMYGRGTADANSYLGLRVNGSPNALHIDSDGNVGIGTTAPSQKLSVVDATPTILNQSSAGDARFYAYADGGDAYMRLTTVSGVSNDWAVGTDRTDGYFKIADNSTLGTNDRLTIDSSGVSTFTGQVTSEDSFKLTTNVSTPTGNAMFRPTSNTLAFATNSVERMRISADGSVGIGGTATTEKLEVYGNALLEGASPTLNINATSGAGTINVKESGTVRCQQAYDSGNDLYYIYAANGKALTLGAGNAERMRISADGSVGIGTADIDGPLDIGFNGGSGTDPYRGGFYFKNSHDTANPNRRVKFDQTTATTFAIQTVNTDETTASDGNIVLQPNGGDVGIGGTPSAKLDVYSSATKYVRVHEAGSIGDLQVLTDNGTVPALGIKGTGTADLVNVWDGTAEVFTILDGGNVGIRENNPSFALEVVADAANWATQIQNDHADGAGLLLTAGKADGTTDALSVENVASTTLLTVKGDGNVGIGATPNTTVNYTTLTIDGAAAGGSIVDLECNAVRIASFYTNSSTDARIITHTTAPLLLGANSVPSVYVVDGGNVGIGADMATATDPVGKLVVSTGDLVLESGVTVNGNADELVIQNDAAAGISILTPNSNSGWLIFGDTDSSNEGMIAYDHGGSVTGSPGADSMLFYTDGSSRMTIDSSGNVGIGVSPTAYSGYNTLTHGDTTGATFEQRIAGVLTGSLTTDSQVTLTAVTEIPLVFKTYNTERMRIDSDGRVTVKKSSNAEVSALTDGATITPDLKDANNFSVTLADNRTLANPSNITAGQSGIITITQDGTGSRTLAYGTYWKFEGGTAPTLTTTASAVDLLVYYAESATRITAKLIKDTK